MNEHARLVNTHTVDQLADTRAQLKILKAREKQLVEEISDMMGDGDSLGGGMWIARQNVTTRKGSIDAKAMTDAGIDVDAYRKPDSLVFSIRLEERAPEAV